MDENGEINPDAAHAISNASVVTDEAIDTMSPGTDGMDPKTVSEPISNPFLHGEIRTLDGDLAGDEFAADAINYQILLEKIDRLLEKLKLDA